MKQPESGGSRQAFRLKGTMPALTLLQMLTPDLEAIEKQLADHLRQMPQFFLHAPVLIDLSECSGGNLDLSRLAVILREHRLVPVAVRNPTPEEEVRAAAAGWGVLQSSLASTRPAPSERAGARRRHEPEPAASAAEQPNPGEDSGDLELPSPGLTVRTPVRSGQVVHAVGGDLVVLAPVSSGAELIADGNVHVYAPLRGRALAGASGAQDVSIFCLNLEAEFLSVAGQYLRADQIDKKYRGRPARAHLSAEGLTLSSL